MTARTRWYWAAFLVSVPGLAVAAVIEGQAAKQQLNVTAVFVFLIFIGLTLVITAWAARRSQTRLDFYTAGGAISGTLNGVAIAGDYMSAAAFLGITALVFSTGFDGLVYGMGFIVGWPIIMFLVAERLRNLGRFTFSDVATYRFQERPIRLIGCLGTLATALLYLIAQMVGAGQLIKLLFGLDYEVAVIVLGVLMMLYVAGGGMLATTWVQIIKAILLLVGVTVMAFLVLKQTGFSLVRLLQQAAALHKNGVAILAPSALIKDPVSAISLGLALMFGTAGLPHILMRFFTVKNAKEARKSVLVAVTSFGYFLMLMIVIGYGAIVLVGTNPAYLDGQVLRGGGNMAAIHLAHAVGGDWFLGFVSAVAFATIIAVVSGLGLSAAAAVSHDFYASFLMNGKGSEKTEILISKLSVLALGVAAVSLGIAFEKLNVAFMVSLPFAVAASTNFPIIVLSLSWRRFTTRGAVVGGCLGLSTAVALTVLGPSIWVRVLGNAAAIFPYDTPALFSMAMAFLGCWLTSILDKSPAAAQEAMRYAEQVVRAETGLGSAAPVSH